MDFIFKQAPENLSENICREIYEKNNKDTTKTLLELWNIKENKKYYNEIQQKWIEIRDICNEHDEELNKFIKNI